MNGREGSLGESYDDSHRAFLQSILARGSLTLKEGQQLLAAILSVKEGHEKQPGEVSEAEFRSYLDAAATAVSPYDYEIRSMKHQLSGTTVWCFVNTTSDPFTQYATVHSAEELYFLKRLLDAIFETYNTKGKEVMAITSLQALKGPIIKGTAGRESIGGANNAANTQTADKGLTREQAERMLQSLVLEGWFERSKDGYHTLSPRALMELRTWLVDTYNDSEDPDDWQRIKFCEACKNIVTAGLRCAERECNMRLHSICETAYWTSRPRKRCSRCDTAWDAKHFVGAKAVTGTKEPIREREQRGSNAGRSDSADAEESRHDESGIEEE